MQKPFTDHKIYSLEIHLEEDQYQVSENARAVPTFEKIDMETALHYIPVSLTCFVYKIRLSGKII